jgi:hypothetical protein
LAAQNMALGGRDASLLFQSMECMIDSIQL